MIDVTGDFPDEMEPGVDSQIRGLGDSLGNAHVDITNISNFLNQFSVEQIDTLDGKRLHILAQILGTGEEVTFSVPFSVSYNADDGKLTIGPGQYIVVNDPTLLPQTDATTGEFAYIRIKHDSAGVLAAEDPVTLNINTERQTATELDVEETFIEYSNILLAEVFEGVLLPQFRFGNCELVLSFTNGKYHYTAAFEGGA